VILFSLLLAANLSLGQAQGGGGAPQQVDPCTLKSGMVGDAQYCDRYWECVSGSPQLYDCPNGLVFVGRNRGIAEGCDYAWRGNYCGDKALANPPIATDHCLALYGIFGHETSCTRYWTCWNGTATEQFCIGGLLYHEDSHSCDWPENVRGCQKHPICKSNPFDNVPLGTSCQRYWACQGGYPRLQRCSADLYFDKVSKRCVNKLPEGCDPPPTPPPQAQVNERSRPQRPVNQRRRQGGSRPQPSRAEQGGLRPQSSRPVQEPRQEPPRTRGRPQRVQQPRAPLRPQPANLRNPQEDQFFEEQQFVEEQFIEEPPQFQEPVLEEEVFLDSPDQGQQDQFFEPDTAGGPVVDGDYYDTTVDEAQLQPLLEEQLPQEEILPEEPQQPPPRSFRPNPLRSSRPQSSRPQFSNARQLPLSPTPLQSSRPLGRRGSRRPPIPGAIQV